MSSKEYSAIDPKLAESLLDAIESELKTRFQEIRKTTYNPNTKGYDYERLLQKFLESYLGGAFDFLVRSGVLDAELKANSIMNSKENEFDVVACYKDAVPKLVYRHLVPYDSVAFIIEVKQTLTISNLKKDLQKFEKLSTLKVGDNRRHTGYEFGRRVFSNPRIQRPLRFLFYYEAKANAKKVFKLLEESSSWDIFVILKENAFYINVTMPVVTNVWKYNLYAQSFKYPLLKAMFYTCTSIEGEFTDSWAIFWNLFRSIPDVPSRSKSENSGKV